MASLERATLTVKTLVALAGALLGLGGSAAVAQYQIHDQSQRVQQLESDNREHDRRIQRTEDLSHEVRDELKELRQDVKELLRRNP